jgi:hypothetical protein
MSFARGSRRSAAASRATLSTAIAAVLIAACSTGDSGGSAERFCGEVESNKDALTNPTLEFSDDIGPLLELYSDVGEVAPLAIEQEWNQLVMAYETASTIVPGDEESEQIALAAIYSSEAAAAAVDQWLRDNCAVDIGPVFTIVEHPD